MKKVFIRSGIRYDYMLCGDNSEFFADLVRYHISGQLKVAPEHCSARVLDYMGKPHFEVYERFKEKYERLNRRYGLEQYLVPYLMSSHPGCTLSDAVDLAVFLNKTGRQPEQVQDFYPTPRDPLHLHVVHGDRPPDHGAGVRGQEPPRQGPPAGPPSSGNGRSYGGW